MARPLARAAVAAGALLACGPVVSDPDGAGTGNGVTSSDASGSDGDDAPPPTTTASSAADSNGSTSPGPTETAAETTAETTGGSFEPLCSGGGDYTLSIIGTQQDYEGLRVWVSAVEPDMNDMKGPDPVVVLLQDVVTDGAFALECPMGLRENNWYPSWAIVVDVDGDGRCSDGDDAFVQQLFGWGRDQLYTMEGDVLLSHETDPPWAVSKNAWQPVDGMLVWDDLPLCEYYFPG